MGEKTDPLELLETYTREFSRKKKTLMSKMKAMRGIKFTGKNDYTQITTIF